MRCSIPNDRLRSFNATVQAGRSDYHLIVANQTMTGIEDRKIGLPMIRCAALEKIRGRAK